MSTIREMVCAFQEEVKNTDLLPERAAEILTKLAALLGNINQEILVREMTYKKKLLECYEKETKANRAKIIAETSPEYEAYKVAINIEKLAVEIMRSLKYYLNVKETEFKSAYHQ